MAENSKIEWTDHTFNPWWGCVRVSPGCVHCYAETFDRRVAGVDNAHWGVKADRRFFGDKHWNEPRKWNARAEAEGRRYRVFCASMADVFEDREDLVPHRARLFSLIEATPFLDWLLLTKRPENMVGLAPPAWASAWPANVWAGCTVEDQQRADERIPELLRVPAAVRFLSCEPLIGPVDIVDQEWWDWRYTYPFYPRGMVRRPIDWVIAGGESGHGARPMHPDWARSLRSQCERAGMTFHFKQWGEWLPLASADEADNFPGAAMIEGENVRWVRVGKHEAGRLLDGRTWDEFPEVVTHA